MRHKRKAYTRDYSCKGFAKIQYINHIMGKWYSQMEEILMETIIFLDERHKERFTTLLIDAELSSSDLERAALFYIIAGNNELFNNRHSIYNFGNNMLKDRKLISKLSSSGKNLVKLGINLYNSCAQKGINVCDLFSILDSTNRTIALNAICIRFRMKQIHF